MGKPYLELSYFQVALAALLILINGAVSVLLKLDLERRLLLAAVCTVVQLLLIGLVLEWVFRMDRWYVVLTMMSDHDADRRASRPSSAPRSVTRGSGSGASSRPGPAPG